MGVSVGLEGLGMWPLLPCPTGQAQVWLDNDLGGQICADLITFRWGPQGCLFCWGEGLPSFPLPPGLLPVSLV